MNPIRRRSIAAALAAASLFVAAGCGGSSSTEAPSGETTAALTADAFRQQADAICKDIDTRVDALGEPSSEAELPAFFEKGLALNNEQITRLKALVPPAELKANFDAALGLLQQQTDLITQARDRIAGGEAALTVINALSPQLDGLEAQAKQKAAELGLVECGKDGDTDSGTTTSATPPPATTEAAPPSTPGQTVGTAVFVADIQTFAQALTQFGLTLQAAADGPEALRARSGLLRSQLDTFDQVTAKMGGYTVDTPTLETKRANIVAASPDISRLGRELLDAAEAGDAGRVTSIASEFTTALERLQAAAAS